MGAERIGGRLATADSRRAARGRSVVWSCDPMHGNTETTASGRKTRPFERIITELRDCFAVHRAEGSQLGGMHIEMTGKDVTECTGGAQQIDEAALVDRYHTHCDPRLNGSQALELAFLVAEQMKEERTVGRHGCTASAAIVSVRLEVHRHAVHAVALPGRAWPVVEHVAEMAAASAAMHLGASHEKAAVLSGTDRAFQRR